MDSAKNLFSDIFYFGSFTLDRLLLALFIEETYKICFLIARTPQIVNLKINILGMQHVRKGDTMNVML